MLTSIIFGMFLMLSLIYYNRHMFIPTKLRDRGCIERVVKMILAKSEVVSDTRDAHIALIRSRECQTALEILIILVGGHHVVNSVCGIDVENLQNILYYQEKQIRANIL